jgi:hypothetical protein
MGHEMERLEIEDLTDEEVADVVKEFIHAFNVNIEKGYRNYQILDICRMFYMKELIEMLVADNDSESAKSVLNELLEINRIHAMNAIDIYRSSKLN